MRKHLKQSLIVLGVVLLFISNPNAVFAQGNSQKNITVTIPDVGLIAVVGNQTTTVSFGLTGPTEAGLPFGGDDQYDSTVWLNYSSVVGQSKPKKDVYVKISNGTVPDGFELRVRAAPNNGQGKGNVGTSTGEISLTSSDQKIVDHIRTGYTGKGNGKGHRLIYHLLIDDIGSVSADDVTTLEITYTITDQ